MKKIVSILLVLMMCIQLSACSDTKESENETKNETGSSQTVTFTDDLGNQVTISNPKKVAAISGSYADVWQLAGGKLTAVTEDALDLSELILPDGIDSVGAVKTPNAELIIGLGIDFCILSSAIPGQVDLRDTLESAGVKTAYFEVETFEDYLSMLKICTDITGREDLYAKNGTDIKSKIDEQKNRVDGTEKTVLLIRAFSTGAKAKGSDNMTGVMLKELGCINIADSNKTLLEDLSMEKIVAENPDYIFVTTMGSSEEAALSYFDGLLKSNKAWSELKAVKNNNYYVLPQNLFHNKPNNRWADSYEQLADILYGTAE